MNPKFIVKHSTTTTESETIHNCQQQLRYKDEQSQKCLRTNRHFISELRRRNTRESLDTALTKCSTQLQGSVSNNTTEVPQVRRVPSIRRGNRNPTRQLVAGQSRTSNYIRRLRIIYCGEPQYCRNPINNISVISNHLKQVAREDSKSFSNSHPGPLRK